MDSMKQLRITFAIFSLWMFIGGFVTATSLSMGGSWSEHQYTMFFPEGGITGGQYVCLFRLFQTAFAALTVVMLFLCGWAYKNWQEE